VGYTYQDVLDVSVDIYNAAMRFISQVLPDPVVRKWVFKRYYKCVQKIVEKIFLIFYNKIGDNGKTAFLKLIGKTFGSLYVKCNNNLLRKTGNTSKSGANEELMGTKGNALIVLSELEGVMDTALARELVGGEEISTRGNYMDKTTFESFALINIGCNTLPTPDSNTEAVFSKFRCVPFEAQFVNADKVDEQNLKFLKDEYVSKSFDDWRPAVMKYMLSLADEEPELPEKVMEHTKNYQTNNDILLEFFGANVERKEGGILTFQSVWEAWKYWVKEEQNNAHKKKAELKEEIQRYFEKGTWFLDTIRDDKRYKQFWIGYTLSSTDYMEAAQDDYN
jgi:phage/plasmid-associated DNA primase